MILIGSNVVYKATLTGLRISSVDGTAFIDNAGATVPTYADGNHLIEIYDASNRMLKGYLKAAGTGTAETGTLGEELVGAGNCTNINYSTFDGVSATGFHAATLGAAKSWAGTADQIVTAANNLYVATYTGTHTSGYGPVVVHAISVAGAEATTVGVLSTGEKTHYWSSTVTNTGVIEFIVPNGSASEFTVASLSVKQVTIPSPNGCTISSTKGGTAMDAWTYKNASFTYNAASYYCIVKAVR